MRWREEWSCRLPPSLKSEFNRCRLFAKHKGGGGWNKKNQKHQRWRRQVVVPGSCLGESNTAIRPNSVSLLYKETGQACVLWPFFFYPAPFLVHHSIRSEINSDTPSFLCQFQSSLSHFAPVDFHFLVFFCLSVVDVRKTAAILVLFPFGCSLCRCLFILCMCMFFLFFFSWSPERRIF